MDGWKAEIDVNIEIAQAERNENRASLESYDLTCQKCSGSTNPSIDPWESFSTNGVKIPVNIGHCEFESVSKVGQDGLHSGVFNLSGIRLKVQTWLTCSSMCWVATGAESVYNLSPTGFEIYLYQTDGEVRDPQIAPKWTVAIVDLTTSPWL